jgi:hypothetical protein
MTFEQRLAMAEEHAPETVLGIMRAGRQRASSPPDQQAQ